MTQGEKYVNQKHLLRYTMRDQLVHGMRVSNLAVMLARELGLSPEFCHDIAIAGMLHDVGKELISNHMDESKERLIVEEMHYVRLHPQAGCKVLEKAGYPENIREMVLYHHENMNGTGYPENLAGDRIPLGARIIRICDVYAALTSDRPYRTAFDKKTAIRLMIEDVDYFDMEIFLAFQRVLHNQEERKVELPEF